MIVYDGYRIGASNYYELRGFMEKHGFNPSQIVSESDRLWVYCQGWQSRALDRLKVKRVTATDLNRLTAKCTVVDLQAAIEAYEHLVSGKLVAKEEEDVLMFGKSYKLTYRVTGEKALFERIQQMRMERGVLRSQISGERLITDNRHKLWVNQFMHVLPKGSYPRYRLLEENIFLGTVAEHHLQTVDPGKTKNRPEWAEFWAKSEELQIRYHAEIR